MFQLLEFWVALSDVLFILHMSYGELKVLKQEENFES